MLLSDQLDLQHTLREIPEWKLVVAKFTGYKIPVGKETHEGWSGQHEFFVFWCRHCHKFGKDYAHSWPETRYLTCQRCGKNTRWPKRSAVLRCHLAVLRLAVRYRFTGRIS